MDHFSQKMKGPVISKKMDPHLTLKLIDLVEENPCLYMYPCDFKTNNEIWKKIDGDLGVKENEAKKQWRRIRNNHYNSSRPRKNGELSKYILADRLQFLSDYMKLKRSSNNQKKTAGSISGTSTQLPTPTPTLLPTPTPTLPPTPSTFAYNASLPAVQPIAPDLMNYWAAIGITHPILPTFPFFTLMQPPTDPILPVINPVYGDFIISMCSGMLIANALTLNAAPNPE